MKPSPPRNSSQPIPPPPPITWAQLEAMLLHFNQQPAGDAEVTAALAAIAKTAKFKPPTLVWLEIAMLVWMTFDETPRLLATTMNGVAPMT